MRGAALAVVLLAAAYVVGSVAVHHSLYPDPAYGLLVRASMMRGAAWNHMTEPDPHDISRDVSYFYAVWSPGQYAVPGALADLGLTLGHAIAATSIAASLAGLFGWFWLWRRLGFDPGVSWLCTLVVAASRTFNYSFLAYTGSDELAFAAFPLLAGTLFALRGRRLGIALVPVAMAVGFYCKNSMLIYVGAWVAGLAVAAALRRQWSWAAMAVAAAAASAAIIDVGYVRRGWSPVSYEPQASALVATYLLPVAMPLLSATSADDVLSRLFAFPGREGFAYKQSAIFLTPIVAATLAVAWHALRARRRDEARMVVLGATGATVAAFIALYATGSGASLDLSRHYLIPGRLLLPLLMAQAWQWPGRMWRVALAVLLAVSAAYGMGSFASNWKRHFDRREAVSGTTGIVHLPLSAPMVAFLHDLDRQLPEGALVALSAPQQALEFSRTRVLPTSAVNIATDALGDQPWAGRVATLVVVAERAGMDDAKVQAWLAAFTGYNPIQWDEVDAGGFRVAVPRGQAVDRAWIAAAWERAERGDGARSR